MVIYSFGVLCMIIHSVEPEAKWLCMHLDLWVNGYILYTEPH